MFIIILIINSVSKSEDKIKLVWTYRGLVNINIIDQMKNKLKVNNNILSKWELKLTGLLKWKARWE